MRKHLAMLSVTHRLLFCHTASYTPLNDAPIIEMMRKGVHNMLAPAPVVQPWWSLALLFRQLRRQAVDPWKCPLTELRDKLIVLMLIDGMGRSSDLESVDVESTSIIESRTVTDAKTRVKTTHPRMLSFFYYNSKTQRGQEQALIAAYPKDPRICTVTVAHAYRIRTIIHACVQRERNVNGETKRFQPFFHLHTLTKGETLFRPLSKQRIAGVAKAMLRSAGIGQPFTAHSTRGASSSKAFNLGAPIAAIIARARWRSPATFMDSYHRPCSYRLIRPEWASLPLEELLRLDVARA